MDGKHQKEKKIRGTVPRLRTTDPHATSPSGGARLRKTQKRGLERKTASCPVRVLASRTRSVVFPKTELAEDVLDADSRYKNSQGLHARKQDLCVQVSRYKISTAMCKFQDTRSPRQVPVDLCVQVSRYKISTASPCVHNSTRKPSFNSHLGRCSEGTPREWALPGGHSTRSSYKHRSGANQDLSSNAARDQHLVLVGGEPTIAGCSLARTEPRGKI
jgi:hypothetical protein